MLFKIIFTLSVCALLAVWFAQLRSPDSIQPGILVITADDLGNHLGSYGDNTVPTPHLDAIAAAGTRFSRAYVTQSSCSASRASFLTGLYPHQNGQLGLANAGFTMTRSWPLLPRLLQEQLGYYTAVAGKLHVSPHSEFSFLDDWEYERGDIWTHDVARVGAVAERLLARAGDRPFYIQFDLRDPHPPFVASYGGLPVQPIGADAVATFSWTGRRTASLATDTANYYNGVSRLDAIVGRILAALASSGRLDNTIIVFWSDNGPAFARAKTTLLEQGVRVPLIVAGPGIVAGRVREELVSMVDIMPTLLHLAGAELPESGEHYVGRNLTPLLRGEDIPWRRYLFTESNFHTARQWAPARAVTNGKWTLIEQLANSESAGRWQLYNLEADPDNRRNLANRPNHQKIRDRLQQKLVEWRTQTDDLLLDPDTLSLMEQVFANPEVSAEPWYSPP